MTRRDHGAGRVDPESDAPLPRPVGAELLLSRLLPLARGCGITRIADLTGLDRLHLPVVQAIRPVALSEVTALGKGRTTSEAAIGAIMESLERHFAEIIPDEGVRTATANELDIPAGLFDGLVVADQSTDWRSVPIPWISSIDVVTGAGQWAPLELVHARYSEPPAAGDGIFARTTTGLACHEEFEAALTHALLECVERDAIAHAFHSSGFFQDRRLGPLDAFGSGVAGLVEIARRAHLLVALWHAPSATGLPVVWCQTVEDGSQPPHVTLPTEGYAARQTIEAAAEAALMEALAARAGAISGAREDQTRHHYRANPAVLSSARELILEQAPFHHPDSIGRGGAGGLASLAATVTKALGPVLAVPLANEARWGVSCVRVILPRARPFFVVR